MRPSFRFSAPAKKPLGTVPKGGLFLTAGADVQKDRIEVDVWAWGRGLESWLVDHVVIDGGPEHQAGWDALAALLGRTWPHAHGAQLQIARLAIDTGYEAPAVYGWAPRPRVDNAMVKALARAFRWRKMLDEGVYGTIEDLAKIKGIAKTYVSGILRLTLLAPEIVEAILDGLQPAGLQLNDLLDGFPLEWAEQGGHMATRGASGAYQDLPKA